VLCFNKQPTNRNVGIWLVVWNIWIMTFYSVGNNHPNWLSYFLEGLSHHQPVYGIFIHRNYHTFMMFGVWFLYAMEQMGYLISGDGRPLEEPFGPGSSRANLRDAAWWHVWENPWENHSSPLCMAWACRFMFKMIRILLGMKTNWYFNWRLRGRLAFRKATHPCSKKQLGKDFSIYQLPVLERMSHICLKLGNNNNDTTQGA